jgi:rhodanese-related sulfurtransferase
MTTQANRTKAMNTRQPPRRLYAWDLAHKLRADTGGPLVVDADDAVTANPRCKVEGAVSLQEFKAKLDSIPKDREIVFYSASFEDRQAVDRAIEYEGAGFSRIAILDGGIQAWSAITPFLAARGSARGTPVL